MTKIIAEMSLKSGNMYAYVCKQTYIFKFIYLFIVYISLITKMINRNYDKMLYVISIVKLVIKSG